MGMACKGSTCRRSTMENSSSTCGETNPVTSPVNASVATSSRRSNVEAIESTNPVTSPVNASVATSSRRSNVEAIESNSQEKSRFSCMRVLNSIETGRLLRKILSERKLDTQISKILLSVIENLRDINSISESKLKVLSNPLPSVLRKHTNCLYTNGNGNCLYNSVSQIMFDSENYTSHMRLLTAFTMLSHPNLFKQYVKNLYREKSFDDYLNDACTDRVWGSDIHIHALSICLGRPINVINKGLKTNCRSIKSFQQQANTGVFNQSFTYFFNEIVETTPNPIYILYSNGNHFSAIITDNVLRVIFCRFSNRFIANEMVHRSNYLTDFYLIERARNHSNIEEFVLTDSDDDECRIISNRTLLKNSDQTSQNGSDVVFLETVDNSQVSNMENIEQEMCKNNSVTKSHIQKGISIQNQKSNIPSKASLRMRKLRSDSSYYQEEKQKNAERNRNKRQTERDSYKIAVKEFNEILRQGPTHVCCICKNIFFKHSVKNITRESLITQNIACKRIKEDDLEICRTCQKKLKEGIVPEHSFLNNVDFDEIPLVLKSMSSLEETLVSPRIPFMTIRNIGCDRQFGLKGAVVNVPTDVSKTVSCIPRAFSDIEVIEVNLKRKLEYKHSYCSELIRPNVVFNAATYLCQQPLYITNKIHISNSWSTVAEANIQNNKPETDDLSIEEDEECLNPGNTETLLCQPDFTLNIAPGEGNTPLNVLHDDDCEALCFPSVYGGKPDPFKKLSISDRVKFKARHVDRRCARIPVLFFNYKLQETQRLSQIISICIRRKKQQKLNVSDCLNDGFMNDMFIEDNAYQFMKALRSSPAYWEAKKKDVFAMIRQLGLPSLFMTFSAAESKWEPLIVILKKVVDNVVISEVDVTNMAYQERARLIRSDPITCARYFENKFRNFMHKIIKHKNGVFKKHPVRDYYVRFEFQHRGSVHAHMVVWLTNAPVYTPGNEKSIEASCKFIDEYSMCASDYLPEHLTKYQTHKHTFSCRKNTNANCRFNIPFLPMKETVILEPLETNITRKRAREKVKNLRSLLDTHDYENLDEFLLDAKLDYEDYVNLIRASLSKSQVFLKRHPKECYINAYNPELINLFQANMDIQFITDAYACVSYVVDYINKSNRGMSTMLRELCANLKNQPMNTIQKIKTIASKFLNATEISAQEAAYHVLELPLTMSSRTVEYINTGEEQDRVRLLKPRNILETMDPESEDIYSANSLVHYYNRPSDMEDLCLADFVSQYTYSTRASNSSIQLMNRDGYIQKRVICKIIRYRRYSDQDKLNYFREMLLLFYPWRNEERDIMEDIEGKFLEHREIILAKRNQYENAGCDLFEIERDSYDSSYDETEDATEYAALYKPGEMVPDIGQKPELSSVTFKRYKLEENSLKKAISNLNSKQYNYIINLWHVLNGQEPFYHFITGGAGTGKSVLINSIAIVVEKFYQILDIKDTTKCRTIITAPTGRAAFNVQGYTLHTAFMIPVSANDNNFLPLSSDTLNKVRNRMYGLKVLIIDEISMVGASLLEKVHLRLQQIFQSSDVFGGISVIAVGDFNQLRPVLDRFVFLPNNQNPYKELAGNPLWDKFKLYKLTEIMRQKEDGVYANVLDRFANHCSTELDMALLASRTNLEPPPTAVHLFPTNKEVDSFNYDRLQSLQTEGITSTAVDTCFGEAPAHVKESFIKSLAKAKKNETQGLPFSLLLKLSAKYMITENINVEDGLVNGAIGILEHITYDEKRERATIVWLKLDKNAGLQQRQRYGHLLKDKPHLTPIFPVNKLVTNKGRSRNLRLYRRQFPLNTAESQTFHKCQGGTYKEVVCHADKVRSHAAAYVALSRVTSASGLYIIGKLPEKFTKNQKVMKAMQDLAEKPAANHFDHLDNRGICSLKIINFNIQSIKNHIDFVLNDNKLANADIICLTETWTKSADYFEFPTFKICGRVDGGSRRQPGGVMILCKKEHNFSMIKEHKTVHSGRCIASALISNGRYAMLAVYAAPGTAIAQVEMHVSFVTQSVPEHEQLIVAGDFNQNLKNKRTKDLVDKMLKNLGCSLIAPEENSTTAGTQIDYAFIRGTTAQTEYYHSLFSYHRPQVITIVDEQYKIQRILSTFGWMVVLVFILWKYRSKVGWLMRCFRERNIQVP